MQKRRRVSVRRVVAVCGLCIWGLAACGGGDGSTTGATPCMGAFCSSSSDSGFVGNSNGSASGVNGSGDAQCDELTSSTDACDACLGASCCSEMAACEADVQCQRFYECAYACEDESCTADCQATYPDGFDVFYAFYECYDASCVTDCAAGDGSSSDGTSATGGAVDAQCSEIKNSADACDACIGSSCCEQLVACDEDAECSGYASCTGACSDEACFADCEGAYPDGYDRFMSYVACFEASCSSACVSSTSDPSAPAPTTCDSLISSGDACSACLGDGCCEEVSQCVEDTGCTSYSTCVADCSDSACESDCAASYPAGYDGFQRLMDCGASLCSTDCVLSGTT